jgi:GTP-binding protein EngB required for normal cell division
LSDQSSQFINSVLGYKAAEVSDGALSCTETVQSFKYEHQDGLTVTLVDTPGFNFMGREGYQTNTEILQMIADFLESE